nr:PREDICTED: nuclear transcription factor Y subunit gamma-like [Daucus carota subsp. sativus]
MRADEDVRMITGETPVLFTKAIGMFAMDMTLRSWNHTKEDKRRIFRPSDGAETDHYEVNPSMPTMEAGDQQSEVYMQLLQLKTTLRPFRDWRQQFAPQNQEAGFVPWAPQPQQNTYDYLRAVACAP